MYTYPILTLHLVKMTGTPIHQMMNFAPIANRSNVAPLKYFKKNVSRKNIFLVLKSVILILKIFGFIWINYINHNFLSFLLFI